MQSHPRHLRPPLGPPRRRLRAPQYPYPRRRLVRSMAAGQWLLRLLRGRQSRPRHVGHQRRSHRAQRRCHDQRHVLPSRESAYPVNGLLWRQRANCGGPWGRVHRCRAGVCALLEVDVLRHVNDYFCFPVAKSVGTVAERKLEL